MKKIALFVLVGFFSAPSFAAVRVGKVGKHTPVKTSGLTKLKIKSTKTTLISAKAKENVNGPGAEEPMGAALGWQ